MFVNDSNIFSNSHFIPSYSKFSLLYLRPLFSQGDVAVGRITRIDVANVLISLLDEKNAPSAVGKTLEVLALSGKYGCCVRADIHLIIELMPYFTLTTFLILFFYHFFSCALSFSLFIHARSPTYTL